MADVSDVIDVCCIATPDGRAFWCQADPETLGTFWANWRASLPAEQRDLHERAGCLGGVVRVRMLESDYRAIPATSESCGLFGAHGVEAQEVPRG
jgi:hypothetical protein